MSAISVRSADAPLDPFWSAASLGPAQVSRVRLAAVLALVPAALILLGWARDINLLKTGLPGQRATQPLSALCFALCALSLVLSTERCLLCRVFRQVCAVAVLLLVVATVRRNELDLAWASLVALGLLCFCLLLTEARSATLRAFYACFTTVGALFCATVLLAYAYGLQAIYTMGGSVAFIPGLELAVLFFGLLLRRPDVGWMRVLADGSVGAAGARRLLLWTGALLAVLAVIVKLGTAMPPARGAGLEVTLLTVGGLGLLLAGVLAHARRLNALETIRHNAISDLRATETQLVRTAHDKDRQLSMLAHELRNPLTPLRNGIEIARQSSGENPALARTLEMMSRQVMQMVRLVDDLVGTQAVLREMPPAEPGESRPLRILIADDNVDAADSLGLLLQAQGHVALTAADGRRAIEIAEAFRPDVILMDIAMPNLDGLEATREIRRLPWGGRVRIIALTAWGQEAERRRTLAAGMNDHLVKPVDLQALAAVLRAGGYSRERM
jgi:CheY-like chemotaxis protein